MLSSIMIDPFAPTAPPTLLSAIKALQAALTNCWPRIPQSPWQDEIINALSLCWLNLLDHDNPDLAPAQAAQVKQELVSVAKTLAAVLQTQEVNLAETITPLVAKEPSLEKLFLGSG